MFYPKLIFIFADNLTDIFTIKIVSTKFFRYVFLFGVLSIVFSTHAERFVTITVPVKQELTQEAFPSDTYVPSFEICNYTDSTVVAKSKTVFNETDVIAPLEVEDENGKFLIHIFVNKLDSEGSLIPSTDFQDVWTELDLSNVKGKRYRTDDILIPIRKIRKSDE